jgi:hypothetical protein
VDEVVGDVWAMGVVIAGKCMAYLWAPMKRMSCTLSWMQMFPSPFMPFIFYSYCFFFQETSWGTLPWHGNHWWQYYPQAFHENEKVGS